ncbi:hypothetical protein ESNG_02915 [Escherichia coli B093]|nr:hypothetical protein ESNG_02915 [Escherichia coli B093]
MSMKMVVLDTNSCTKAMSLNVIKCYEHGLLIESVE